MNIDTSTIFGETHLIEEKKTFRRAAGMGSFCGWNLRGPQHRSSLTSPIRYPSLASKRGNGGLMMIVSRGLANRSQSPHPALFEPPWFPPSATTRQFQHQPPSPASQLRHRQYPTPTSMSSISSISCPADLTFRALFLATPWFHLPVSPPTARASFRWTAAASLPPWPPARPRGSGRRRAGRHRRWRRRRWLKHWEFDVLFVEENCFCKCTCYIMLHVWSFLRFLWNIRGGLFIWDFLLVQEWLGDFCYWCRMSCWFSFSPVVSWTREWCIKPSGKPIDTGILFLHICFPPMVGLNVWWWNFK